MFEVTLYSTPTDVARAHGVCFDRVLSIGPLPSVVLFSSTSHSVISQLLAQGNA